MGATSARDSATAYDPHSSAPSTAPSRTRIPSIDIVRGLVVILMAIDHVRVYSGQPAGGPTPGIFFTRWVTHFVAPSFVFLAGVGAYLYGRRVNDKRKLATFLITRGLWLVLLELTVLRVAWTFNVDFANYMLAGVIWMIGWCMVLMAGVVFLPRAVIAVGSLAIIALHNASFFGNALGSLPFAPIWKVVYLGGQVQLGANGPPLLILFVLVPWIAVMAAGYAFGPVMELPSERRRAICMRIGLAAIAAFVLLRALDGYGDQRHWHSIQAPAPLAFLSTSKYPASLLFLLMTLGPMLVLLSLVDQAKGRVASALETFGRVPFFYYLLHIPTIHLAAVIVSLVREGSVNAWLFANHPLAPPPPPPGYIWSLPLLYLVWAIVIAVLYVPCRWFAGLKARNKSTLLSYL